MGKRVSRAELARREAAVLRALDAVDWHRPCDLARRAGLPLAAVVAALKRLAYANRVERRELVLRVIRGRQRPRYTSKLLVEYRELRRQDWSVLPSWLHMRPPGAQAGCRR